MALTEDQKQSIRQTMSSMYQDIPNTGYNMKACFKKQPDGNITIDYQCAKKGGEAAGKNMQDLWGK